MFVVEKIVRISPCTSLHNGSRSALHASLISDFSFRLVGFGEVRPATILVNNTGGPPHGSILEVDPYEFGKAFRRHVMASHILLRALLPNMQGAGYGRIINIISTSVREPIAGLGVSNTTRGAMASWSKSVSKELPAGVTINNILPGYTDTERLTELKNAKAESPGPPAALHGDYTGIDPWVCEEAELIRDTMEGPTES